MIGVASIIFDTEGTWIFRSKMSAEGESGNRRATRTATLDGGVAVSDLGYSEGDREISVKEEEAMTEAVAFAKRMCETYTLVTVVTESGAYYAVPYGWGYKDGMLTMKLQVTEKISE